MDISPFQIAKKISSALKNKHLIEQRHKELDENPIVGTSTDGLVKAVFNGKSYRIDKIEFDGMSESDLEKIKAAVNNAYDNFDNAWKDLE